MPHSGPTVIQSCHPGLLQVRCLISWPSPGPSMALHLNHQGLPGPASRSLAHNCTFVLHQPHPHSPHCKLSGFLQCHEHAMLSLDAMSLHGKLPLPGTIFLSLDPFTWLTPTHPSCLSLDTTCSEKSSPTHPTQTMWAFLGAPEWPVILPSCTSTGLRLPTVEAHGKLRSTLVLFITCTAQHLL